MSPKIKFDLEQRQRLENEIVPACVDDPEYAAAEILRLEMERDDALRDRDQHRESLSVCWSLRKELTALARQLAEAGEGLARRWASSPDWDEALAEAHKKGVGNGN